MRSAYWRTLAAMCIFTPAMGSVAFAQGSVPSTLLTLTASSGMGSGSYTITPDMGVMDHNKGTFTWTLTQPVEILNDKQQIIATVNPGTEMFIDWDPVVSLNFSVTAGPADTAFSIASVLVEFDAISPASARATAGIVATDLNGDGVSVAGDLAGKAYAANYNGLHPAGVNFASLYDSDSTDEAFGGVGDASAFPDTGFMPIGVPVSSMSTAFQFTLSAGDTASGTSAFTVIPEPASMMLLAAGMLPLARTIRRRA